jgi:hypothetical protein
VRDIDKAIAKLEVANARIISAGGQTVTLNFPDTTARVIFAQDPDGFFIGISQRTPVPENSAPATSNIIADELELAV